MRLNLKIIVISKEICKKTCKPKILGLLIIWLQCIKAKWRGALAIMFHKCYLKPSEVELNTKKFRQASKPMVMLKNLILVRGPKLDTKDLTKLVTLVFNLLVYQNVNTSLVFKLKPNTIKCHTTSKVPKGLDTRNFKKLRKAMHQKCMVDRGLLRGPVFNHLNTKANFTSQSLGVDIKCLRTNNKNNINYKNNKIIFLIGHLDNLKLAYEKIKKKPANFILDGTSQKMLNNISKKLLAGKFEFKPCKAHFIKKPNGDVRQINSADAESKIVQQAIKQILEHIFLNFSNNAFGATNNDGGTHGALKKLKQKAKGVVWLFKGDIKKNFDRVNHNILIKALKQKITCEKTITLIKKLIKAGVIINKHHFKSKTGLLQGLILSPLLNQIYLDKFDKFLENTIIKFNTGKSRKTSKTYKNLKYKIKTNKDPVILKQLNKQLKKTPSKDLFDKNFKRCIYVRYIDDFIIGITADKTTANNLIMSIKGFLLINLKLTLNNDKSKMVNFNKTNVSFLGVNLKNKTYEKQKKEMVMVRGGKKIKTKMTGQLSLMAPIEDLLKKLKKRGFLKQSNNDYQPTKIGWLINLEHADIVQYFNSIINGILNYYSFANNFKSLGTIVHLLKHSCALTLALKLRLRHRAKVFKKFGTHLECPISKKKLHIPKTFKAKKQFQITNTTNDLKFLDIKWHNKLTKSNLNKKCLVCGSENPEMHHVKTIKNLKLKLSKKKLDFWTLQMAAINRKQIPLCSLHHHKLHNNSLSEIEKLVLKANLKKYK